MSIETKIMMAGAPLNEAKAAMIMIHGRGATAEDILSLTQYFDPGSVAYLAPQAANQAWYPDRFTAPVEANEPYLSASLGILGALLKQTAAGGIAAKNTILLGFSQGACLSLEYAARNPQRYGGVIALSGGLIGETVSPTQYEGSLDGTPVFLGCSDVDFHIPLERVQESTEIMRGLDGEATEKIYPGMDHTVNMDELEHVRQMMAKMLGE